MSRPPNNAEWNRSLENDQLSAIVNATTDFVVLVDKNGKIIQVNQALADECGLPPDQLIGTSFFSNASDAVTQRRRELVDYVLSSGRSERIGVKDHDRYLEYSAFPTAEQQTSEFMVVLFIRDITQHQEIMEEHEQNRRILKEANAELEGIIRIASHDLKTPLVTINGFAGELSRSCHQLVSLLAQCDKLNPIRAQVQDIVEKDIQVDIDLIKAGTGKIESLVSSLLKLAKIGYIVPQTEVVEMNGLIDEILKSMAYQIKDTNVQFDVEPLCDCLGDESMINQVMTNLISNAIKYRHPDRPGQINISCRKQGDHCVYCVADNGIGVAQSHQEKIFELFYRLNPETADGQGLGLSIVRGILARHNGRIWLESEPDKGSRFYVTFPGSTCSCGIA